MTPPIDLVRLRARDPELLGALVRELSPQLLVVIRGYARDADHADDLLQECWIHILERLDGYRPRSPFARWAAAVARNVCKSSLRKEKQLGIEEVPIDAVAHVPSPAPDAEERMERRRLRIALFEGLGALPDREREAIVLSVLEGRPTRVVAETLGVSPAAAREMVRRGLDRMRRMRSVNRAVTEWLEGDVAK